MAAQNSVDICNLALDHLNQAPITQFTTPTTKTEKLCDRWYDNSRKACLRMHIWNFAIKRDTLAVSVTAPNHGYATQYNLPSDYIRIAEIGESNKYKNYAIENGKLLLSEGGGALNIRYVYDNTSVEQYDPLFVELLAIHLAYNLAYPLTGNLGIKNTMRALLDEKRREAFSVDGQERPPKRVERSRFRDARRNYGYYGSKYLED